MEEINALHCLVEASFLQLYGLGLVLGIRNLKFTVPSLWVDSPRTREIQRCHRNMFIGFSFSFVAVLTAGIYVNIRI